MEDDELNFTNQDVFPGIDMSDDVSSRYFMGGIFDEFLKDTHVCTHIHTCNPPGPDNSHTHSCFHTHTRLISASEGGESLDESGQNSFSNSKKRPQGNREAVRKYREKKKAHTASLEGEILQLKTLNQKLMKKIQNQSLLEAEITRLRCLLADLRSRIDGELTSCLHQNQPRTDKHGDSFLQIMPSRCALNSGNADLVNPSCNADVSCPHTTFQNECYNAKNKCQSLQDNVHASRGVSVCSVCSDSTLTSMVPIDISPREQRKTGVGLSQCPGDRSVSGC